jgi:hypothetical protein
MSWHAPGDGGAVDRPAVVVPGEQHLAVGCNREVWVESARWVGRGRPAPDRLCGRPPPCERCVCRSQRFWGEAPGQLERAAARDGPCERDLSPADHHRDRAAVRRHPARRWFAVSRSHGDIDPFARSAAAPAPSDSRIAARVGRDRVSIGRRHGDQALCRRPPGVGRVRAHQQRNTHTGRGEKCSNGPTVETARYRGIVKKLLALRYLAADCERKTGPASRSDSAPVAA